MSQLISNWLAYAERYAGDAHTVAGALWVLPDVWSPQLGNRRDVLIYLPPAYERESRRYPVVYMHDGQNLFDRATSFAGEEWQVDETLEALSGEGLAAIVVGIPHMGEERLAEYTPHAISRRGRGEKYLTFVCETIKSMIDREFRTQADRAHTGIFGSSMGGLISLYAFFHRSETFGLVGAMSPSLWVGRGAMVDYVSRAPHVPGKIYLDNGTREGSAHRLHALLRDKGYQDDHDLLYVVEPGGRHTESAWARRLPDALRFLLKKISIHE